MRAEQNDLMQGFRYHAIADDGTGTDLLQPAESREGEGMGVQAGFQSITLPELSTEAAEYREGTFQWTQKYPGVPVVSDMTLIRGIAKKDTAFFELIMNALEGSRYRMDITVYHFQRSEMGSAYAIDKADTTGVRKVVAHNSFASRAKPSGDLDSMASEVSMAEVDIALENFDVKFD